MSSASRKLIQASGAVAGPADTGDDDFANVVLLLDGDGTSGDDNNTFTDSSTNSYTITENGSVVQGSFSPYGDNWSNYFDGSGDYLSGIGSVSDFNFMHNTTALFTLEAWLYHTASGAVEFFFANARNSADVGILAAVNSSDKLNLNIYKGSSGNWVVAHASTATVPSNTWTHICIEWDYVSDSGTMYINGAVDSTFSKTSTATTSNAADSLYIGKNKTDTAYMFEGYISNLRVSNSIVYGGAFTPSTAPLTTTSQSATNVELLTCQSNRFVDNSSNAHSITSNGDTKVTPFSPFKNDDARDITTDGGSGFSETVSDRLSTPTTINAKFGTSAFTVEGWIYPKDLTDQYNTIFDYGTNAGTTGAWWALHVGSNGAIGLYTNNGNTSVVSPSGAVRVGEWSHFAVVRSGTTFTVYVNGVNVGSTTASFNMNDSNTRTLYIYYQISSDRHFNGYLSDARIVRATAVYTSAFTPPTSPLTAITNTELLLNFQDAGIYDRTGINNVDAVGNAQIDTAVKKYGTGSMQFDGTGDSIGINQPFFRNELAPTGTVDFTIEAWININAHKSYNYIYSQGYPIQWVVTSSGVIQTYFNETDNATTYFTLHQTGGSALSTGTWYHVAITRDAASFRLFLDGVQVGYQSYSAATSIGVTSLTPKIGDWAAGGYSMNGYIDDFRITRGVARYTSAFTPPTEALPKF